METKLQVDDARDELGAALAAALPTDEPCIMAHIRAAYVALGGRLRDHESQRLYWEDDR